MKKRTGKLIAASPAVSADILYAGGFNAPDEVIYFEAGREKGLILSQLEYARGRQEARKTVSVLNREAFLDDSGDRSDRAVLLNLSRRYDIAEWHVPGDFPLLTADFLRANGIGVLPAKGEFMPYKVDNFVAGINDNTIECICNIIKNQEHALICLNDSDENIDFESLSYKLRKEFEILFPVKSSFEIEEG